MHKDARIFIADDHGLIGEAIRTRLRADGYENLLGDPGNPSLIDAREVEAFFHGLCLNTFSPWAASRAALAPIKHSQRI